MGCNSSKPVVVSLDDKFFEACQQGDLRTVHELLKSGIAAPSLGLHRAASGGHLAVIRRLLAEPACDINAKDDLGMTALAWACVAGEPQAVDKLIRSKADVNLVANDLSSPLMLALAAPLWRILYQQEIATQGIIPVIRKLRSLEEESASKEHEKRIAELQWTPSEAAQRARHEYGALYCRIAKDLVRRRPPSESGFRYIRANPSFKNQNGSTALSHATALGHATAVVMLISPGSKVDVNETCPRTGVTALMRAGGLGHADLVECLLVNGAAVNAVSHSGMTALMWSADGGHETIVRRLIGKGADIDALSNEGYTALLLALCKAMPEHEHVVKLLLDKGASPNAGHFKGQTALHVAVSNGSEGLVKLLLSHAAELNQVNANGDSPLMHALLLGHNQIVHSILQLAFQQPNLDLGLEICSQDYTLLSLAVEKSEATLVRALIRAGADVNASAPLGTHPLLIAAKSGNVDILQVLLEAPGVDVEVTNSRGSTPLMIACSLGHTGAVIALLQHNANTCIQNSHGNTPLVVALSLKHIQVVDALLCSGKDLAVNAENENQSIALDYVDLLPVSQGERDRIRNVLIYDKGAIPRPVVLPQPPPEPVWSGYSQESDAFSSGGSGAYRTNSSGGSNTGAGRRMRSSENLSERRSTGEKWAKAALGVFKAVHVGLEIGFTIAELLGGL